MQSHSRNDNITPDTMGKRQGNILDLLEGLKTDSLLLTDLKNIRYFCGFSGSSAWLLITKKGNFLFTDGRYEIQAHEEVVCAEVVVTKKMLESLRKTVADAGINSISFEARDLSYYQWKQLRDKISDKDLHPTHDEVRQLRIVKEGREVEIIRKGAGIAKESFFSILGSIRPGNRERDVALALEVEMRKRGAAKVSFDIIVASGKRSALPHALPTDKVIEEGDLVVVDFGVEIDGYHTDETCTIRVGAVDAEAEKIYGIVSDAQTLAIKMIRPGVKAKEIDLAARDYISKNGYGAFFGHGAGHGVGLDIHELPVINEESETVLQEGMVFTVEPGIYLPHVGGVRIEDMVLVTAKGYEILTKCNNTLRG